MANNGQNLEEKIEDFIEHLRETAIIAEGPDGNQELFVEKMEGILEQFKIIDDARHLSSVEVPLEVLRYIDEGKNPDLYARQKLEMAKSKNDATRGKLESLKAFRDGIKEEMQKIIPDDFAEFEKHVR